MNDNALFNANEFKEQLRQNLKELNNDLSMSLGPILPGEIQKIVGGDMREDSAGYIEEDDDEDFDPFEGGSFLDAIKEGERGGDLPSPKEKSPKVFTNLYQRLAKTTSNSQVNLLKIKSPKGKSRRESPIFLPPQPKMEGDRIIILSSEELKEVFYGKLKYSKDKFSLTYDGKEINMGNETKLLKVLKPEQLLIILKYLYSEIHPLLMEMSDNFLEERRKFFLTDHNTYVSIINYFIRKKEEYFLCVLSDIMSRLNISQQNLDNTFYYYLNVANPSEDILVKNINEAYDNVYYSGIK
jgi:hypothetical protein